MSSGTSATVVTLIGPVGTELNSSYSLSVYATATYLLSRGPYFEARTRDLCWR